jgi:hypothetical protein
MPSLQNLHGRLHAALETAEKLHLRGALRVQQRRLGEPVRLAVQEFEHDEDGDGHVALFAKADDDGNDDDADRDERRGGGGDREVGLAQEGLREREQVDSLVQKHFSANFNSFFWTC